MSHLIAVRWTCGCFYLERSTECDSRIQCRLERVKLFDEAKMQILDDKYEALSYTWGDPKGQRRAIFVNGHELQITFNLSAFLRQRREPDQNVVLWVDALCINQKDNNEKNEQIRLMSMIYASASKLTVWLGPASEDSHVTIQNLLRLGTAGSPYHKLSVLPRDVLKAIHNLFERSWWTRVWIIQEASHRRRGTKVCHDKGTLWARQHLVDKSCCRGRSFQGPRRGC